MIDQTTILLCDDCAEAAGLKRVDRIGGTWEPVRCRKCGKRDFLGEYARPAATDERRPGEPKV